MQNFIATELGKVNEHERCMGMYPVDSLRWNISYWVESTTVQFKWSHFFQWVIENILFIIDDSYVDCLENDTFPAVVTESLFNPTYLFFVSINDILKLIN